MSDKFAIFSVTDKRRIVELADKVSETRQIIASGGTARRLRSEGIEVISVEDYTGFPELFQGRVKSLHPRIHGGILFKDNEKDRMEAEENNIGEIDLVVCNLYNFAKAVETDPRAENAVESIDIGGPTLIRAAAKNYDRVSVLVDPDDYEYFIENFPNITIEDRITLAAKAFSIVTHYDIEISKYMGKIAELNKSFFDRSLEENYFIGGKLVENLRYGENPHQVAAYYKENEPFYQQIAGPEASYNNILDMVAGYSLAHEFNDPAAVIIKHRTPCGVASDNTILEAYRNALKTDKMSAYGGVYCFNRMIDKPMAEELIEMFVDVILAPDYDNDAIEILQQKKKMTILKRLPGANVMHEITSVPGGFLLQQRDFNILSTDQMFNVSDKKADKKTREELEFAWRVVKHSKSNAIVVSKDSRALGIGSGQTSRVEATKQALERAGEEVKGAVLASDAFFPFPDSIDTAAEYGIKAIISPRGSIRDNQVIEAANKHDIILVFTGVRAFKH